MHPQVIVLLHHNDFISLQRTIESIFINTLIPFRLCIIDNKSEKNDSFWKNLKIKYDLEIIFNKKNNWIYGFNCANKYFNSKYILLSDSDILVPKPQNEECWLGHLINQMELFPYIGKLGLSLDLCNIKKNPNLKNTYDHEITFKSGIKIGKNIIAPTDSTMAIYRTDIFITKFKMRIGHMRLIKPYYYSARTSDEYKCIHLGWSKYDKKIVNKKELKIYAVNKAKFFSRYGIKFPTDLLLQLNIFQILRYKIIFNIIRLIHGMKIYIYWLLYAIKTYPKNSYL